MNTNKKKPKQEKGVERHLRRKQSKDKKKNSSPKPS